MNPILYKLMKPMLPRRNSLQAGLSLIEVIVVVGLMAVIYAVAAPDLLMNEQAEIRLKLNRFAEDIRSAYDTSVLTGKPIRMVVDFYGNQYWFETTEAARFKIGDQKIERDPTPEEEQAIAEELEEKFVTYEELAGREVNDPEDESVIKPTSPLLKAKEKLMPVEWKVIDNAELSRRELGEAIMIQDMQAEHHDAPLKFEDMEEGELGMIYFFPSGYVERAYLHIAFTQAPLVPDPDVPPFTVTTNPYEGTANVVGEFVEINLDKDEES